MEETANEQEVEHIPVTPTSEIIMRIEEIPPMDVFYSPQHKAMVKRKRTKIKLDSVAATTLENELMDVLWKDSPVDPSANLTRLSQFAGAYATTTIEKAIEVQMMLREKENKITSLEKQLWQVKSDQRAEIQLAKLQQEFEQMQIEHRISLVKKEAQVHAITDLHKDDPKID